MKEVPMGPADGNRLLAALPSAVLDRLAPSLARVRLKAGDRLSEAGGAADRVWFPTSGLISQFLMTKDGQMIETASIGREGIIGLPEIFCRNRVEYWTQVQVAGEALTIQARRLRAAIRQEAEFSDLLLAYACFLNGQRAQAMICDRFHTAEQRLARWLLLAMDRVPLSILSLTHDDMAQVLGVSRSRISQAAGALQRKKAIYYLRGRIEILSRDRLILTSCECYEPLRRMMAEFLQPAA